MNIVEVLRSFNSMKMASQLFRSEHSIGAKPGAQNGGSTLIFIR